MALSDGTEGWHDGSGESPAEGAQTASGAARRGKLTDGSSQPEREPRRRQGTERANGADGSQLRTVAAAVAPSVRSSESAWILGADELRASLRSTS